jgi:DNA-binding IclR family transcriptional regulator
VEKVESPQLPNTVSRIGVSVPLYCTAVGKTLLAFLPPDELGRVLRQIEPKCRTAHTVRNTDELRKQIERVRRSGYSFDMEENELQVRCVAAPIWDHSGNVNASLSVSGPAKRMPMARMRELAPVVQEAGIRISRELGYHGSVGPDAEWKLCENGAGDRSLAKTGLREAVQ